jgi:DNA replication protein DnaC
MMPTQPAASLPPVDLDGLLKRLHLANTRRVWRDLLVRAEREEWTYEYFLTLLVAEEIAQRQQTRLVRLSRRAGFPFFKTIDDFDFTYQSTVRLALLGSALSPDFITEGRALVLVGKPGRGKTHLAVAIAYRAIQNGFTARFVTAAELIDDLSAAFRTGRLAEALTAYTQPDVLVVDEVGYLTYGTDAANMLFHVVNDRHRRRRAMIFTTNKPLNQWGRVLHDEDLAQAIVDRVLERGRPLTLDGPSHRTKHLGLDDPTVDTPSPEVARISGIHAPEFPEPTIGGQAASHGDNVRQPPGAPLCRSVIVGITPPSSKRGSLSPRCGTRARSRSCRSGLICTPPDHRVEGPAARRRGAALRPRPGGRAPRGRENAPRQDWRARARE